MKTKDYVLLVGIVITVAIAVMTAFLMNEQGAIFEKVVGRIVLIFVFSWVVGILIFIVFKLILKFFNFFRNI